MIERLLKPTHYEVRAKTWTGIEVNLPFTKKFPTKKGCELFCTNSQIINARDAGKRFHGFYYPAPVYDEVKLSELKASILAICSLLAALIYFLYNH